MGPDGAKGERGEPGMTVSAWALPQGSIGRCWQETRSKHTQRLDIWVMFVSAFCSVPLSVLNSGGWSQGVRSLRDESALWWVFYAACIANLLQKKGSCPQVELKMVNRAHESQPQLNFMKVWLKRSHGSIMILVKLTFNVASLSLCFLPVSICPILSVWRWVSRSAAAKDRRLERRLWFSMSHSATLYHICPCRAYSESKQPHAYICSPTYALMYALVNRLNRCSLSLRRTTYCTR